MHKKIKKVIALTLILGTIPVIRTSNGFMPGSIEAYASTYKNATNGQLSSLTITRSTGSEIKLRNSYYGDEVSLSEKKEYYLELTGADGFQISADVEGGGYVVKQFTSADKTEKGQDVGQYINIDSNFENIYLRTYKSEDAYKDAYDNGDVTDCERTYAIHVKKSEVIESDKELDKDYAYLESIYLSNGNIDFSKSKYSYNINVKDNIEEILIRATPENNDDLVEINGKSVEEKDNFEKTISLNKGNNTITIYVKSNDDDETYTLNVYRGDVSDSINSLNITSTSTNIGKYNSWQKIDGKWQYLDGTGDALKNQWWFDKNTGKDYYLKEDGYMATGWLNNNNNWYYLSENGAMQTGWIYSNGSWYYLSKSGVMQTGWLKDSDGKWYYLDSTGKMIENQNRE